MSAKKEKKRNSGKDEIEHVVVLMLENRSFDNILGNLYSQPPSSSEAHAPSPNFIYVKNGEIIKQQNNGDNNDNNNNNNGDDDNDDDDNDDDKKKEKHENSFYGADHLKQLLRNEELDEYLKEFNFNQTNTSFPFFGPGEHIRHVAKQLYNKKLDDVNWNEEATLEERLKGTMKDYKKTKKDQFKKVENKLSELSDQKKKEVEDEKILSFFSTETLPVINTLASQFAVCDYWFASVPSQTWPNRCFLHSGSSGGALINEGKREMADAFIKIHKNLPQSIFTSMKSHQIVRCNTSYRGLTWILHCNSISDSFKINLRSMKDFKKQCKSDKLPHYTFIEPHFFNFNKNYQNDQHPLGNILGVFSNPGISNQLSVNFAEKLILKIYKYLFTSLKKNKKKKKNSTNEHESSDDGHDNSTQVRKKQKINNDNNDDNVGAGDDDDDDMSIFKKRLFIILYDENGGNFDHIFPPKCSAPPHSGKAQVDFEFERLGVRVPAIFISPLIEKHSVLRSENKKVGFDHTSLIKSLISRFGDQFDDDKKQKFLKNERISNAPEFWPIITPTTHKTTHDLHSIYDQLTLSLNKKMGEIEKKAISNRPNERIISILAAERMKFELFAPKSLYSKRPSVIDDSEAHSVIPKPKLFVSNLLSTQSLESHDDVDINTDDAGDDELRYKVLEFYEQLENNNDKTEKVVAKLLKHNPFKIE